MSSQQDSPMARPGDDLTMALQAAAEEATQSVIARSLRTIASRINEGASLAEAVGGLRTRLPAALQGAFAAAAETDDVSRTLFDILEYQNDRRWRKRGLLLQLSYPGLVLAISILVFCGVQVTVVKQFGTMFEDFGIRLPTLTTIVLWWANIGAWMVLSLFVVVLSALLLTSAMAAKPAWHRLLGAMPLLGPIWRRIGHSEATRVLAALVKSDVPLPRALSLASSCCSNQDVAMLWSRLAHRIEGGATLTHAIASQTRIPAEVAPFVHWGETTKCLAQSLESVSELLGEQADANGLQLTWLLPPIVLGIAFVTIICTALSLFLPLLVILGGLA